MSRVFALPLAGLLVAAVVLRAIRPSPPPPVIDSPVAVEAAEVVAEPAPEPAPAARAVPTSAVFVEPVLGAEELRPLVEARFPDETILAFARVTGRVFRPTAEEAEALRKAGMSDVLLGRLTGVPDPPRAAAPSPVHVPPSITVYAPVTVTVVEAPPPAPAPPPETFISTVVLVCAAHGRAGCCGDPDFSRPAIYQKPPFFKTHAVMPTRRLPTAEEVARREESRATRIFR